MPKHSEPQFDTGSPTEPGVPACPQCGYDLTGIPESRCPECGYGFEHRAIRDLVETEYSVALVATLRSAQRAGAALMLLGLTMVGGTGGDTLGLMLLALLPVIGLLFWHRSVRGGRFAIPELLLALVCWPVAALIIAMAPQLVILAGVALVLWGWAAFGRSAFSSPWVAQNLSRSQRRRLTLARVAMWSGLVIGSAMMLVSLGL